MKSYIFRILLPLILLSAPGIAAPPPESSFNFAVVGGLDAHSLASEIGPASDIARAVSLLSPDFTIILGPTEPSPIPSPDKLQELLLRFSSPVRLFIPAAAAPSDALRWTSFRHSGSLFISILEDIASPAISEQELSWLASQLQSDPSPDHIFIFTNFPLWRDGRTLDAWDSHVHPLLAQAHADGVIAFQAGLYVQFPSRDEILYLVTGGALTPPGPTHLGFPHFLFATVRGADVRIALIRPESVLPTGAVQSDTLLPLNALLETLSRPLLLPVSQLRSATQSHTFSIPINLSNPLETVLLLSASWDLPIGWSAYPSPVSLEPGESIEHQLSLTAPPGALNRPLPRCTWYVTAPQPHSPLALGGSAAAPLVTAFADASWTSTPPAIDGRLDDWPSSHPISVDKASQLIAGSDFWQGLEDASAEIRLATDSGWLYLSLSYRDDDLYGGPAADPDTLVLVLGPARIVVAPSPDFSDVWVNFLAEGKAELRLTAETAAVSSPSNLDLEIKIPISTLEKLLNLPDDRLIPFDLFIVDADKDGAEYSVMSWTGLARTWETPRLQGRIRLTK